MKQMKKKKIEGCDDRRFRFFWNGVAVDRLRNFPPCSDSSRMMERLIRHVFSSFFMFSPFYHSSVHLLWRLRNHEMGAANCRPKTTRVIT
jgi:hypothetical protein